MRTFSVLAKNRSVKQSMNVNDNQNFFGSRHTRMLPANLENSVRKDNLDRIISERKMLSNNLYANPDYAMYYDQ